MKKEIQNLRDLFCVLWDDVVGCKQQLESTKGAFWARAYIRCLFSTIEGMAFSMRQVLLTQPNLPLSIEERIALSEKAVTVCKDGHADLTREMFLPFKQGFLLTFKIWARWRGLDQFWQAHQNGWADLCATSAVRDRLTHPKNAVDVHISRGISKWHLKPKSGGSM